MNKLTRVRKALGENSKVNIVAVEEKNYLLNGDGTWGHTVDFYVAPKNGGIYNVNELQALIMSLVPELEPTHKDNFCERECVMEFGKLYFDEDIGTEFIHRSIVLTDENMISLFNKHGFINGKQAIISSTKKIKRRIWIRLFPSEEIASAAFKDDGNK